MSWQATNWAMREASTHGDARAKLVLMCLADYARPDGTGAYPKIATISAVTEIPERTVIRKLNLLKDMGLIRLGDQRLVAGYARDKRPVVYDLAVGVGGESGMEPAVEEARHAEANEATGCQDDTPHVYKEERGDKMTPRTSPRGDTGDTPRGDKTTPHIRNNKEINKNTPIAPKGARRHEIPEGWKPSADSMRLAQRLGADAARELERFRLHAQANRRRLADWDKGFQLWLKTGTAHAAMAGGPVGKPHTHSWACDHTRAILSRFGIEAAENLKLACMVAERLKSGMEPDDVADMLAAEREREWTEAA